MTEEEFELVAKDGVILRGKYWVPEGEVKAVVCLVHGLGEHSGRYTYLAKIFYESGVAVFGFDLRGHGRSEGKRGHAQSYSLLLEDVESILKKARAEFNDSPLFLLGHSLGGNIAANYILRRSTRELAGAILSSPWLTLSLSLSPWQMKLLRFINNYFPSFSINTHLDPSLLTHDLEEERAFREDPLVHTRITVGNFVKCHQAGQWAIDHAEKLKIPALVLHGNDDKITGIKGSRQFAAKGGKKVQLKIWPGLRHEPHHEKRKDMVIHFLKEWILVHSR